MYDYKYVSRYLANLGAKKLCSLQEALPFKGIFPYGVTGVTARMFPFHGTRGLESRSTGRDGSDVKAFGAPFSSVSDRRETTCVIEHGIHIGEAHHGKGQQMTYKFSWRCR